MGGSITAQGGGWRPTLLRLWGDDASGPFRHGVRAIDSHMGNVGTPVLTFLAEDWVLRHEPDLVFVEAAVNDGDHILENGRRGEEDVRRALEGLVRQIRQRLPRCKICFVLMYLRTYLPAGRRTGTQAWADGHFSQVELDSVYKSKVPDIYGALAEHYGCALLDLGAGLFARLTRSAHEVLFRDDCHHTALGALASALAVDLAFRASSAGVNPADGRAHLAARLRAAAATTELGAAAVEEVLGALGSSGLFAVPAAPEAVSPPGPRRPQGLPGCLDPLHWTGGRAVLVGPESLRPPAGGWGAGGAASRQRRDRDPIRGEPLDWWLLRPGDELRMAFSGVGFGILTHVGPDSGWVSYAFTPRGGGGVRSGPGANASSTSGPTTTD